MQMAQGALREHDHFMQMALLEARRAGEGGEVPVGAVLVSEGGSVLAKDHNRTVSLCDPTAHAELLVLREGARKTGNYRLTNETLYTTVEPCLMCMGALIHARVKRVVFGAADPRWGAAGSLYDFSSDRRLNHHPELLGGVCEGQCRAAIQAFFRERR